MVRIPWPGFYQGSVVSWPNLKEGAALKLLQAQKADIERGKLNKGRQGICRQGVKLRPAFFCRISKFFGDTSLFTFPAQALAHPIPQIKLSIVQASVLLS